LTNRTYFDTFHYMKTGKRIHVVFYKSLSGNEPVRQWLQKLSPEERKEVGKDIKMIEFCWPVGLPQVRKLDNQLWEVRCMLPNKIARVFFTIYDPSNMVLLHACIKKSQKTPQEDLDTAKKRRNEIMNGGKIL
jgi:phage-related protein